MTISISRILLTHQRYEVEKLDVGGIQGHEPMSSLVEICYKLYREQKDLD